MARERHRLRRRPKTPPRESFLSGVLGEYLDPIDSLFSILYSVLFALVFTLSYEILIYRGGTESGFSSGYGQRLALVTLGAVTGWGIIEGAAYLLGSLLARSERHRLLRAVQASSSDEEAVSTVADELDFILEPITSDEQRNALYHDMLGYLRHAEPRAAGFQREDVVGALTVVLLYIVAVLPSMLPLFLVPDNFPLAIRVSNVVSLLSSSRRASRGERTPTPTPGRPACCWPLRAWPWSWSPCSWEASRAPRPARRGSRPRPEPRRCAGHARRSVPGTRPPARRAGDRLRRACRAP